MSSLKTLAVAGAVAMVAATAGLSTTASAADLMPPPMVAPPPPPIADGMSGLYLRGDVGVGAMSSSTMKSRITDTTVNYSGSMPIIVDKANFGDQAFAGVGVGYQFNNFLRVDLTGEYRTASQFSGVVSFADPAKTTCISGRCYDNYTASIRSGVFLANAYADLGNWRGFSPFLGAGVGFANHKVSGLRDTGVQPAGGFGMAPDVSKTSFAWALMAGVGYDVTRNLKMEMGYRYLNMGNVDSGVISCQNVTICPKEVQKYSLQSHDIKIGFRYMLNDDAPAPMAYAPGPVVRKY